MMYLRDEMNPDDLANWRYGFNCDDEYEFWYLNIGRDADEISLLLFGA